MRSILFVGWTCAALLVTGTANAASTVIAGSELAAPPSFWPTSFWGITQTIERAFPFQIAGDRPFQIDELQIAAFHYPNLPGSQARFTIHEDAGGVPGPLVAQFLFSGIPTTPQILFSLPTSEATLFPATPYWIVGGTSQQQVNWNLADSVFGRVAYRVAGDNWIIDENRNVSAFAILGSVTIPEPSGAALAVVAGIMLWHFRNRPLRAINRVGQ